MRRIVSSMAIVDCKQPGAKIERTFPDAINPAPATVDVVIIGGGASGILTAIHLVKGTNSLLRIAIIESRAELGKGIAYSTTCPEHRLNVVAGRMSAFEADPDHFLRYLNRYRTAESSEFPGRGSSCFASRETYGRYLSQTLDESLITTGCSLVILRDEVVRISSGETSQIELASGSRLTSGTVVLAIGNFLREFALGDPVTEQTHVVKTPWDQGALSHIASGETVLVLGGGLSMVDAVIELAARGHTATIHILSRHGLRPLSHGVPGDVDGIDLAALLAQSVRGRTRMLRAQARLAQANGAPWQWVMDTIRPHGGTLWASLDAAEQRRFLRHVSRFWDVHRHRIAPQIASQLTVLETEGRLSYHAGHVRDLQAVGSGWQVGFRPKSRDGIESITVGHVLNCTGLQTNIERIASPLIRDLLSQGAIRPGPHHLGLDTDSDGRIRDHAGRANDRFFALGTLRIGQAWESVAVPELRKQAQAIAAQIIAISHQTMRIAESAAGSLAETSWSR